MAPLPQPDLPHPAHVEKDSALGRKFGKEVTNYFGSESRCPKTGLALTGVQAPH
jgi:hypothetical protein